MTGTPHDGAGHWARPQDLYLSRPPWGIGRPQPAFRALAFADGWQIDSIVPATIDITTDPDGIRAWLVALTRI